MERIEEKFGIQKTDRLFLDIPDSFMKFLILESLRTQGYRVAIIDDMSNLTNLEDDNLLCVKFLFPI